MIKYKYLYRDVKFNKQTEPMETLANSECHAMLYDRKEETINIDQLKKHNTNMTEDGFYKIL